MPTARTLAMVESTSRIPPSLPSSSATSASESHLNDSGILSAALHLMILAGSDRPGIVSCCSEPMTSPALTYSERLLLQHRRRVGVQQEDLPRDSALQLAGASGSPCSVAVLLTRQQISALVCNTRQPRHVETLHCAHIQVEMSSYLKYDLKVSPMVTNGNEGQC